MNLGIHLLRALSAILVVYYHALSMMELRDIAWRWKYTEYLHLGVDLFFIISGYVVTKSTRSQIKVQRFEPITFLKRRAFRIVPMYWLVTLTFTIASLLIPGLSDRTITFLRLIKSLVFFPILDFGRGTIQTTIVPVGWTLIYEMFFYFIFCISFIFARKAKTSGYAIIFSVIFGLICLRPYTNNPYVLLYSKPLISQFAIGIMLGLVEIRLSKAIATAITLFGVTALIYTYPIIPPSEWKNMFITPILACIVFGFSSFPYKSIGVFSLLGDASYSIYLIHGYFLKRILFHGWPNSLFGLVTSGVVAIIVGIVAHIFIEKSLSKILSSARIHSTAQSTLKQQSE